MLDAGVFDLPLIWQSDAFALATSYDKAADRYVGLWTPEDNASHPVATDSLLLVRPDVAQRQIDATTPPTRRAVETPVPVDSPDQPQTPPRRAVDVVYPAVKTRFFGVKTLNSAKIALDFKNIAEEVLAHLRSGDTNLTVRIEIEATDTSGFDEAKIRTISENAKTLRFDQAGFEES